MVSGAPAIDHRLWLKCCAAYAKLPEMAKAVRKLSGHRHLSWLFGAARLPLPFCGHARRLSQFQGSRGWACFRFCAEPGAHPSFFESVGSHPE
jgi:hypothetical protein